MPEPDPELDPIQDHSEREEVEEEGEHTSVSEEEEGTGTAQPESNESQEGLRDVDNQVLTQHNMPAPLSAAPSSPVQASYLSTVV